MVTVTGGPGTITGWDNPEERRQFYLRMLPTAQKWSAKTGIPVSVYLAINAHESNFGKSDALFGIKGSGPKGSQNLATWEAGPGGERININDSFRAYNSDDEAYADFHNLISQGRYAPAWQQYQQTRDPIGLLNGIVAAGYATDKNWGNKISQVANRFQQEMQQFGIDPGKPAPQSENVSATVAARPAVSVNRTPVQGQITSRFGTPFPMDSGATYQGQAYPHFNKGVDFGAAGGSPVTAVVGGTVKLAGDDGSGWGPRVIITDAEGFDHSYGHLDAQSVAALRPGAKVESGQQIGVVASGRAGTSTGPHLSYDIFRGGEPVDPSPWLGQDVREPGIPASAQTPSYLSGAAGPTTRGGVGMPTTPAFSYTSPYQSQIEALRTQQQKDRARLAELAPKASTDQSAALEAMNLQPAIDEREKQIIDLIKIDQSERQFAWEQHQATVGQQADAATAVAGLRQRGFENSRSTVEAISNIINTAFGQRLDLANILRLVDDANRTARLNELNTMMAMGQLDMAQAAMRFDVQERQQAAELAWTAQAAAKAGWIADEERKNALMFLPEGTHFQPGFEPNGAINATFAKWGIPPMVIGVAEVDRSRFDPETNMLRGAGIQTAMGAPRPQFDTSETTDAADRVRGIAGTDVSLGRTNPASLNLPAPMNTDALIGQLPQNPNTADIESFLQGLMNPDVGIPRGIAAGTEPPAQTWPSGGAVNQVGEAPTEEATAAAQAALQPGQGFSPGTTPYQGMTQNSPIQSPKKDDKPSGLTGVTSSVRDALARIPGAAPGGPGVSEAVGREIISAAGRASEDPSGTADTIWDWLTRKRKVPGVR